MLKKLAGCLHITVAARPSAGLKRIIVLTPINLIKEKDFTKTKKRPHWA